MELARRAQQMDLERVAADLAHDTSRAVEEPATDAEVQCELDDCATQRPLDEGRGKLCGLHLAVQAEVEYSARAGER